MPTNNPIPNGDVNAQLAASLAKVVQDSISELPPAQLQDKLMELFEGYLEAGVADDSKYLGEMFWILRQIIRTQTQLHNLLVSEKHAA